MATSNPKCSSYTKYETRKRNPYPKTSILLVIDAQNHFSSMIDPILPNLLSIIQLCRRASVPVLFTRHNHKSPEDYGMLEEWWDGDLIIDGTPESELIPPIAELAAEEGGGEVTIEKSTYSAFAQTRLQEKLDFRSDFFLNGSQFFP
ncbi:unnamed protein product [Linum trigynum]|uniref:Isochorismatase-like domain-containing protein n=1 Tax=Linum trigynum TaxID=586398 RepID=A0AAV2DDT9_9ROSI